MSRVLLRGLLPALLSVTLFCNPSFAANDRPKAKPPIIVIAVKGAWLSPDEKVSYRAAVAKGLMNMYTVSSGAEVDKKVGEIFEKESWKAGYNTNKCLVAVAKEFHMGPFN